MKSVVLCVDEVSLAHPEWLGLEGESLVAQTWLQTFSGAWEVRRALATASEVDEVWVASNDEVEPINLAAILKADRPDRAVFLVSLEPSGSLMSRARIAGLDGVLTQAEFVARYGRWKHEDLERVSLASREAHAELGQGCLVRTREQRKGGVYRDDRDEECVREVVVKPLGKHAAVPVVNKEQKSPIPQVVSVTRMNAAESSKAVDVEVSDRSQKFEDSKVLSGFSKGQSTSTLAKRAFLMPVISASGGSGKSAIAAMAAVLTQRAGLKTVLVDLDLQFGDMREAFGVEEALGLDELLAAPARINQVVNAGDMPALLCAPRNLELAEDVVARLSEVLDLLCSRFDVVIANTGSFWADEHMVLLERCSRALFVIDQRPSSLRACQRALDLCMRCGIAVSPLVFAVNKCSRQGLYTSIDVSCALHGATARELYWGGDQVGELLAAGNALELATSRNALVESLGVMLGELVPQMPQVETARPSTRFSLWGMLTGRSREEQPCL